jgi:hypothetical protein
LRSRGSEKEHDFAQENARHMCDTLSHAGCGKTFQVALPELREPPNSSPLSDQIAKDRKAHQADLTGFSQMPEALFRGASGLIRRPIRAAKLSEMRVLSLRFLGFLLRMKRDTIIG